MTGFIHKGTEPLVKLDTQMRGSGEMFPSQT